MGNGHSCLPTSNTSLFCSIRTGHKASRLSMMVQSGSFLSQPVQVLVLLVAVTKVSASVSHERQWIQGIPTELPLLSKKRISHDTDLFEFSLTSKESPESKTSSDCNVTLGIGICSCLLVSPSSNREIVRPFTPVSNRNKVGSFSLLVKQYPNGSMSNEFSKLKTGDGMLFWQIPKNIKEQYPFGNPETILMLAAGTGITPMFQALQRIFGQDEGDEESTSDVVLVFGCHKKSDVYLKKELEQMKGRYPNRLKIVYAISSMKNQRRGSNFRMGRINKDMIDSVCSMENIDRSNCQTWVCGPPEFYNDLCGPREETKLSGVLNELGFKEDSVIKF